MQRKLTVLSAALLVTAMVAPAFATVTVFFDPQDSVVGVGGTVNVDIRATFSEPVTGWGLDVNIADPSVATLTGFSVAGPWTPAASLDGDDIAGLIFPNGLVGNVLLGTLTFSGNSIGVTDISLSAGPEEDEGFLLESTGQLDPNVTFVDGTITVPEPGALALLALGGVAILRRRK